AAARAAGRWRRPEAWRRRGAGWADRSATGASRWRPTPPWAGSSPATERASTTSPTPWPTSRRRWSISGRSGQSSWTRRHGSAGGAPGSHSSIPPTWPVPLWNWGSWSREHADRWHQPGDPGRGGAGRGGRRGRRRPARPRHGEGVASAPPGTVERAAGLGAGGPAAPSRGPHRLGPAGSPRRSLLTPPSLRYRRQLG